MNHPVQARFALRWTLIPAALALLLVLLARVTPAAAWQGDGRINLAGHLGGDTVYCVDASLNPTSNPNGAGIRLLNEHGESLFYVAPEQINAVPHNPAANTIIAQGKGSYGDVYLSRLTDGRFQLTGFDEHGKLYVFEWTDCVQVTPIPNGHSNGSVSYTGQLAAACRAYYDGGDLEECLAVVNDLKIVCTIQELSAKECADIFIAPHS